MPFRRQALLSPEIEVALAKQLLPLWAQGLKADEIADELRFGHGDYQRLKPYHIYFYRIKFNSAQYEHLKQFKEQFPRRKEGIPKGKPRYTDKAEEMMQFEEFEELLDEGLPKCDENMMKRSLCILHFWSPLRRSELLERERRDFAVKNDCLVITLKRKKKYYGPNAKPEPFNLPLDMPLINEVMLYLKTFKPRSKERVFNFKGRKAWAMMKEVFGTYPHFFRFNFVTKAVENAEDVRTLLPALLADTGMDIQTVTGYVMKSSKNVAQISRRELELIRKRHANA
jgi:integrase